MTVYGPFPQGCRALSAPRFDLPPAPSPEEGKGAALSIPPGEMKNNKELTIPLVDALRGCLVGLGPGDPQERVFGEIKSVHRAFTSAVKRSGLKGRVTFHTLRKTADNFLRMNRVDVKVRQKLGGWSDPKVMLDEYENPSMDELRQAASILDNLVG